MGSFTPPPTAPGARALAPGDRLDRYELLCVLAQGGMGTVWLSRLTGRLGFERLVALKTILPTYSADRQFCDMFLDEAKIAAQIDHENVARILEIGEDHGLLYYAMELIDGESLRKLYRDVRTTGATFPMPIALRIVADACAGLHATHELRDEEGRPLQVVHRDVSPQNLLVTVRGTTKLIDFGVAKANARRSEETTAGTLKGKIEYMAPEQARGEPLDRRADVYSLGAVLYELLAGAPVRDTDEGRQLVALHELMTGVPYAPLPPNIPHLVRLLVDRTLSREPRQRYASADDLRRALEQAMLATGNVATHADVANALAHHSRARTAKRKDAIEQALRSVTEGRLEAATIFAPLTAPVPSATSPSGAPTSAPSVHTAAMPMTGPPSAPPSFSGNDGPPTGPSMRTIGPSSMSAAPAPRSSFAKVALATLVLALVALLGVVAGVLVTRREAPMARFLGAPGPAASGVLPATAEVATGAVVDAPPPPAVVIEPVPPGTGTGTGLVVAETQDAAAANAPGGRTARDGGPSAPTASSGRRPSSKPHGVKPGGKAGDGDEYGF